MLDKKDIRILNDDGYYSEYEYPECIEFANNQLHAFWLHTEPSVELDKQQLLVELSDEERESIIKVLKLFVHYEMTIGNSFWSQIGNVMPRSEIIRMTSIFSAMESSVHAPFYNEINRILDIDYPEFYLEYKNEKVLKDRMEFLNSQCNLSKKSTIIDILTTLATFSFIEGCVLYSSFAFLKSFQANGYNKIGHIVTGVDWVVRDENLHQQAAAYLYNTLLNECKLNQFEYIELCERVDKVYKSVVEHEIEISKLVFKNGSINDINHNDMIKFIKNRASHCLGFLNTNLGSGIVEGDKSSINQWFYGNINAPKLGDFFVRTSTEYSKKWSENKLKWSMYD